MSSNIINLFGYVTALLFLILAAMAQFGFGDQEDFYTFLHTGLLFLIMTNITASDKP